MDALRRSWNPISALPRHGQCKQTSKQKFFCSWSRSVRNSAITRWTSASPLLHQLCSKRGYSFEWKAAKLHDWSKMGRQLLVQWTTQYFSLYQDCHHIPEAVCLQHRDQRISPLFQKIGNMIIPSNDLKWQACMRETDADRSWQAGHGEPWTSRRDRTRGIQRKAFLIGAHVLAHSSERAISDSEGDASKVETQQTEAQCSFLLPQKPREVCSRAQNPKWRMWISEHSPIRCRGYKISPLSGIRVKPRLHRKRRRIYERSCSRRKSQKLFIRTIYWNLASIVKNYFGIIEQPHLLAQRQAELQNEVYVEKTSAVLLQSGSDDKWWSDSVTCCYYLRDVQNLMADGKTPNERSFGESL